MCLCFFPLEREEINKVREIEERKEEKDGIQGMHDFVHNMHREV